MAKPIRVAVEDAAFCFNTACPFCLGSMFGGTTDYAECTRKDCDNHRRGSGPRLPLTPDFPPFALPDPAESRPEWPEAPE